MSITDELKKTHMDILKAIEGLTPEELACERTIGDWSVRDVIFHIAMWEGEALKALAVWRTGHDYDWTYAKDIQMFNEFWIVAGRPLTTGQVLQMFNLVHSALVADVGAIPDEIWEKRGGVPKWLRSVSVLHNEKHIMKIIAYKKSLAK